MLVLVLTYIPLFCLVHWYGPRRQIHVFLCRLQDGGQG